MGEDRLAEINTNVLQELALGLVDGHGKGKPDGELQMGQSEVKALTGGECAAIDQVMLSIKVTTIDVHLQTAADCACHGQVSAIAKALVGIKILEQYQRSTNMKLQSHARQVGSIQTVKKLCSEFLTASGVLIQICLIVGVKRKEVIMHLLKEEVVELINLIITECEDSTANKELRVSMGEEELMQGIDVADEVINQICLIYCMQEVDGTNEMRAV